MRKLLIAGLAVLLLTGIAYAQVARPDASESWRTFLGASEPQTCRDVGYIARNVGAFTTVASIEYQCVLTWGDAVKGAGTAAWIRVTPPAAR